MDSRILHIAFHRALSTVAWDKHGENEYVMVGDGITVDQDALQSLIDGTFPDEVLWLSAGRHNATSIERQHAAREMTKLLPSGYSPVTISDDQVHKFIQLVRLGIARTGTARGNYSFKRGKG